MKTHVHTIKRTTLQLAFTALFLLFMGSPQVRAQALAGTKQIPGTYPSIAAAVADLNINGVGSGGVIFDITAGHTETVSATISLTATGTASDPIIFRKSGAGANPVITAYTGGTGTPATAVQDGIWRLIGSDYVTIDGIDLSDPNTTNPATMEYGYALYKASATNGAQNNTIKNCVISLSRSNNEAGSGPSAEGSRGIDVVNAISSAATTALSPTLAFGTNSFNAFYSNTIKNCNVGISIIGHAAASPFTAADAGNDIGGNSAVTGNTIVNFGGAAGASNAAAGILTLNQYGINVSYNTVNNNDGNGVNHPNTLRGIYLNTATSASGTCSYNNVTVKGGGTTQAVYAINVAFGSTAASNTVNVNNNIVENCSYSTATSGTLYGIYTSTNAAVLNINNNIIRNSTINSSTGSFYGINWTSNPPVCSISNNLVDNLSRSGAGTTYCIYSGSSSVSETINNNTVSNITNSNVSTSSCTIYGIYQATASGIKEFRNNTVYNLSIPSNTSTSGNTILGMYVGYGSAINISGNTIYGLSGVVHSLAGITGAGITAGAVCTISRNKIYDLSSTASGESVIVSGIRAMDKSFKISNNLIGSLTATAAGAAEAIRGISLTGTTSSTYDSVYHNTIYINAASSGTNFGTTGIYHTASATATTATLYLQNNIIVNTSTPSGTGLTVAFRRSSTALGNYAGSSNSNLFYTGSTLSGASPLLFDGTNKDSTIGLLKMRFNGRDAISFTELPVWNSTAGASSNFLSISTSNQTQVESKAVRISTDTTDFGGNIRQGSVGYPAQVNGGGTASDVGAWEFDGMPLSAPVFLSAVSHSPAAVQCTPSARTISATISAGSGSITGVDLIYTINGLPQPDLGMSNVGSNTWQASIPATLAPRDVVTYWVRANNSFNLSNTVRGLSYADQPTDASWIQTSVSPSVVCLGSQAMLTASVIKPNSGIIGSGTLTTSAVANYDYISPFDHYYGGMKTQYLIRASELKASGIASGSILALSLDVVVPGGSYNTFAINMAHTSQNAMTTTMISSGLVQVYSASAVTPVAGINTYDFTTPFAWDGISNVMVQFCWSNTNSGGTSTQVRYDNPGFVCESYYRVDNSPAVNLCPSSTVTNTLSARPKMIFKGGLPVQAYTWTDGATTVGSGNPFAVSPGQNTSYSVTVTDTAGCQITGTTPVTVSVINTFLSGVVQVGSGQVYPTLTSAVNAYNSICNINGAIVFELTDAVYGPNETFPIVITNNPAASAANHLTIKPAAGNNVTITGKNGGSILRLMGCDYVTIDGSNNGTDSRNLTIVNDTASSTVVWISSNGLADRAQSNVIRNTNIKGISGTATSSTIAGIASGSGAGLGVQSETPLQNNRIENNSITRVQNAMYLYGNAASPDSGWVITGNKCGSATDVADRLAYRGVFIGNTRNFNISGNTVSGLTAIGTAYGIQTFGVIDSGFIRKNIVSDIKTTAASPVTGIYLASTITASRTWVDNNSVSDIEGLGSSTLDNNAAGITVESGGGYNIYFNSVNMSSAQVTGSSFAIYIKSGITGVGSLNIRNNTFVNRSAAVHTRYAIYSAAAASVFADINYNNYLSAGTDLGYLTSALTGLAEWRTATAKDVNSISVNPSYNGLTNLRPYLGSAILGVGTSIPGLTTDMLGVSRNNPPSIGAYESGADATGPVISYALLSNDVNNPGNMRQLTAFATLSDITATDVNNGTRPRIYYKKKGDANVFSGNTSGDNGWKWVEATNTTSPFDFTIDYSLLFGGTVSHLDTIQYFVTAQDAVMPANVSANPSAGFAATSVGSIISAPAVPNQYQIVNLPALSGSYDVGAGLVSPNYTTITAAVNDLKLRGANGPVLFNLVDASYGASETFPIVLSEYPGASAVNTATIKPAPGVNVRVSGPSNLAVIKYANKAQYCIVDGSNNGTSSRNLVIHNTAAIASSVVWFEGLADAEGVRTSVLKNTIVKGGSNSTAFGVLVGGSAINLTSNGAGTRNIQIANNNIYNCYYGVVISGTSSTNKIQQIELSDNDIGSDTAGMHIRYYGVYTKFADGIRVHRNHIFNMLTTTTENNAGIQILDHTTNSTFSSNRIHKIYSTSTGGYGAYGINAGNNNGIDNDSIYNNSIYDVITSNYSVTSTVNNAFGIRLAGGTNMKIYHNSINLYGQPAGGTAASASGALMIVTGTNVTYSGIDIRNNIFRNSMTGAISGSKHYAFWTTVAAPISGAVFDYNNFYATGTHGILMNGNGTDISTLGSLRTVTGANAASINVDPQFARMDSLIPGLGTGITGGAVAISGITNDILGITRNTTPSMGAYENGVDINPPVIIYTSLPNHSNVGTATSRVLTAFATITDYSGVNVNNGSKPRLYYKKITDNSVFIGNTSANNGWKWVEAGNNASPFDFTIDYSLLTGGGVSNGDIIQYFVVAQDNSPAALLGANPSAGLVGSSVSSITAEPGTPNQYIIVSQPPLNGAYSIGAGQVSPNYSSITAALSDLNLRGVSGPVVFNLADASYSTSETFPITITPYMGLSATNTLTIKPASGVNATVTGSASAIFKLDGADYVTIDGSNNGSSGRNLTLVNNQTSANTAVIWVASNGMGAGAANNTIKNTIVTGGVYNTTRVFGIFSAGQTISNTADGADNDTLTIQNNVIRKVAHGIYAKGIAITGLHDKLVVTGNTIGDSTISTNTVGMTGIYLLHCNNTDITRNSLLSIVSGDIDGSAVNGDGPEGILLEAGVKNTRVTENVVSGVVYTGTGGYGGKGIDLNTGDSASNIVVANNMVTGISGDGWNSLTGDGIQGIRIMGTTGDVKVYNNTVVLEDSTRAGTTTASFSAAFYAAASTKRLDVRNNIFVNTLVGRIGTSKAYAVATDIANINTSNSIFNYNNYYVAGMQGVLGYKAADVATLAAWRNATAQDVQSANVPVFFAKTKAGDLHLAGASLGDVNLIGTPLVGFPTDIDGDTRHTTYPYMGADETTPSLPVELVTFTATAKGNDVQVSWSTASETNNKGFDVERSVDGNTFTKVNFVKGAGNSNRLNSYMLEDANAFANANTSTLYYRLKQLDFDNDYSYSQVVTVTQGVVNGPGKQLLVYPNPFNSEVLVNVYSSLGTTAQVNLTDINGKLILSRNYSLVEGNNGLIINNLDGIKAGIYFISIIQHDQVVVKKLIKN